MLKTCTKVEDLVCGNCIYGYSLCDILLCHLVRLQAYSIREVQVLFRYTLQPVAACEYLFKQLKDAANKNYFRICNDGILKLSALNNVGIVCSSVFLTDKIIEFTVRANVEFK